MFMEKGMYMHGTQAWVKDSFQKNTTKENFLLL